MMKKAVSLIMCLMLLISVSAYAADFNNSALSKLDGYKYDKFTKSWSYYEAYVEKYSDGNVVIGMKIYSEDGSSNPSMGELYVKIIDKDGNSIRTVENITFLINGTLYTYETLLPGSSSSSVIIGEGSMELIKALADASDVSVKIGHNRGYTTIDLNKKDFETSLKRFCKNWLTYDYYKYVSEENLEFIRMVEDYMPLTVTK